MLSLLLGQSVVVPCDIGEPHGHHHGGDDGHPLYSFAVVSLVPLSLTALRSKIASVSWWVQSMARMEGWLLCRPSGINSTQPS